MKTKLLSLSALFIFGFFFAGRSQQTLDQSQTVYNAGTSGRNLPGYTIWQSFTAGITGTLTQIDIGFFNSINGVGTLDIYSGTGTGGTLLQTQTVNVVCGNGSFILPFAVSAPVTAGNVYTFNFTPGAGIPDPYGIQAEVPGTYAGGEMAIVDPSGTSLPGFDLVFNTYVDVTLGVSKNLLKENEVKIFPNPATSNFTLSLQKFSSNTEIFIYNFCGQKVLSSGLTSQQTIIDVAELAKGIYFVEVKSGSEIIRKKFVIE